MICAIPWAAVLSIEVIRELPAPLIRLGAKKMMRTTVTILNSTNRKNLLITSVSSLQISFLFDTIINDELTHVYIARQFGCAYDFASSVMWQAWRRQAKITRSHCRITHDGIR